MSKDARGSLENLEGLLLRARMQPGSLRTPQNLRHQNLQDLDARQMAEDLSADAAARRRQQRQQRSQQLEAKALDAYTKFQGALADHQQQMKRMKEISERAELRHERLSLLVEEANGMFLEFHPEQPVRRKPKLLHVDWQPPRVIDVDIGSAAWPAPRRVSVEYPGSAAWPASRRVSIEYPGSAPLPESRRVSVEYPVEPICPTEPLGRQGRASGWELDPEPMDLQEIAGLRVVSSGDLQLPSTVPSAQAVKRGSMLVPSPHVSARLNPSQV
ncbi:unnamed protein product [Effrenium voratum]|uniref:Uncharacterized protein n=1 Tax=Effrenium voratum TaxID=2562239 RepID=A0AA36HLV0_9DINO|nr:unnamed protein product [Effrenium voratum]CAJ1413033.1 unnamed protein product [Effrenium voratum]